MVGGQLKIKAWHQAQPLTHSLCSRNAGGRKYSALPMRGQFHGVHLRSLRIKKSGVFWNKIQGKHSPYLACTACNFASTKVNSNKT
jgi:hypothetical protein